MPLLLPLDTSASAPPQSLPAAVILDALEPLRCPSHLVTDDATEETASCPMCYASLEVDEVEALVHSKAVLWQSRVYSSFHEVVLSLFNYFPHHEGLRCAYTGRRG